MSHSGPWLRYTPTSEQEVVVLFTLLLPDLPMRLELDEIREKFPDCLAWKVAEDGTRSPLRIEFELYASHFRLHGHDPDGCDLIVCWEDDVPDFSVDRLELRPLVEKAAPPVIAVPLRPKYQATNWTETTFLSECAIEERQAQRELLSWARKRCGEVVLGKGDRVASWRFLIPLPNRRTCTLFGVNADGTFWPHWQRLPSDLGELYTRGLRQSPTFKAAIEAGKAWCVARLSDEVALSTLQAAVTAVTSHLEGRRP